MSDLDFFLSKLSGLLAGCGAGIYADAAPGVCPHVVIRQGEDELHLQSLLAGEFARLDGSLYELK